MTYGAETLEENMRFIEDALGKDLRKYFVKDFYKDHCAIYQVTGSGKTAYLLDVQKSPG